MNMIYMLLPGTPITYYGEEIGMDDGKATGSDVREAFRTPMQWSDGSNAGKYQTIGKIFLMMTIQNGGSGLQDFLTPLLGWP